MGIINCSVCGSMNDSQWENCCECSNQLLDAETAARAGEREDCKEILDAACEEFELSGLHHLQAYKQLKVLRDNTAKVKVRTQSTHDEVFAIPVRKNGKRTTFYTETLPFVPGPGVEVIGQPVRMVTAQAAVTPEAWRRSVYHAEECLTGCLASPDIARRLDAETVRKIIAGLQATRFAMIDATHDMIKEEV